MLKPFQWLVPCLLGSILSAASASEYGMVYSACLNSFTQQYRQQCTSSFLMVNVPIATLDPDQWVNGCVQNKIANNAADQKHCREVANQAYGTTLTAEGNRERGSGEECVAVPGQECASDPGVKTPETVPIPRPRPNPFRAAAPPSTGADPKAAAPARAAATPKSTEPDPKIESARATESAARTAPQDFSAAQSEAQNDLSMCGGATNGAVNCCNNPMACMSAQERARYNTNTSARGGLTGSCSQMSQLGGTSAALNNRLSGICAGGQQACSTSCESLVGKYQALAANCNGCSAQSVYEQTLSQLMSSRNTCAGLQRQAAMLARQAAEGNGGATYGDNCQQQAGLSPGGMPSSMGARVDAADPYGCDADPNSLACRGSPQAARQLNSGSGGAAFQEPGAAKPDFNPAPMTATSVAQLPPFRGDATTNKANVVANNSGGGVPGQGGSSGGARLDPKAPKGAVQPAGGASTDIMQGDRSGGYSQAAGNGGGFEDPGGAFQRGRRFASNGLASVSRAVGLDLKLYLPGGSRDPNSRVAGLAGKSQINGKAEDIFRIISNKMVEKCKLGVLWRCD